MLALFSMVTMSQTLFWLTFSPISGFARGYFHLCDGFDTNSTADAGGAKPTTIQRAMTPVIRCILTPIPLFLDGFPGHPSL